MKKRPNLAIEEPELALQWHPTKNGTLTPEMVSCASNRKVWWYMPYDDPESGKHFIFEWEERIFNRVRGHGCPVLTGRIAWPGYNDLATKRPDLAGQWHPTKNGSLVPEMVTCGSGKKVWWMLIYEDPVTGESFTIEWQEKVCYRTDERRRDFTKKKDVRLKANCLAVKRPDLAGEWHPTKNGGLTPEMVSCGSNIKVWWYRPYEDPESGKHFDFEWPQVISSRTRGYGCPILVGLMVWPGFNDLASKEPDLAEQWHPTKNGTLTPDKVVSGSRKEVWWQLPYDDPNTGKHFDFEWKEQICVRMRWPGCPIVSGRMTWPGFNDLVTKNPAIAAQWHPTKNGDLTPEMVTSGSNKKVYWHMPYDDPATGKHFDFEWEEQICERSKGYGCPVLSNHIVWPGFNDLATCYPQIANEWHPIKNRKVTPAKIYKETSKKVWWQCTECGSEWYASVKGRTVDGAGCPKCRKNRTYYL